jgi:4'-phosphopantetheinyl transferase
MASSLLVAGGLHVLALQTPETSLRDRARLIVRQALCEELAKHLAVKEESIALVCAPGTPIRLATPWERIGISVSHEPGLSLAAINLDGAVGVDLMRLGEPLPDIEMLARDYLGPTASLAIAGQSAAMRQLAFARAWTRHEASLKCLAVPLGEWTPELEARLAACSSTELAMPAGWVAAVATSRASTKP